MKVKDYLEEWVLWGGVPYQRGEIYKWAEENEVGAMYLARTLDGPALDPREAIAQRELCERAGLVP